MIINILIGLVGLGIVILVHETGHFIAAKWMGIEVEAFSLGWGKPLLRYKHGETEYRISMIPMGGYCKMKGENALKKAWEDKSESLPKEKGDFYAASPLQRIFVALSGPLANLIFAAVVLSFIWGTGFTYQTYGNRIVMVSDYQLETEPAGAEYPADRAGLKTGDKILSINGKTITNYREIQETVAPAGDKELLLTVEREGREITTRITPDLDRETGVGRIGVYAWIEPIIGQVEPGSPASRAGLANGDKITKIDGNQIKHSIDFSKILANEPEKIEITCVRGGNEFSTTLVPRYTEEGTMELGFSFAAFTVNTPNYSPFEAIGKGVEETVSTLNLTLRGIALLFKGLNISEAVSGPIRISYYVGEITTTGFQLGFTRGITSLFQFLSFLSIAVFVMNLLPIPLLDGGLILLFLIEGVVRKPLKPVILYRYQTVGMMLILVIVAFTLFNDVLFLFNQ